MAKRDLMQTEISCLGIAFLFLEDLLQEKELKF